MSAVVIITITVAAGILAATVIAFVVLAVAGSLLEHLRTHENRQANQLAHDIDAEYRAARRAMNEEAGHTWRNLID